MCGANDRLDPEGPTRQESDRCPDQRKKTEKSSEEKLADELSGYYANRGPLAEVLGCGLPMALICLFLAIGSFMQGRNDGLELLAVLGGIALIVALPFFVRFMSRRKIARLVKAVEGPAETDLSPIRAAESLRRRGYEVDEQAGLVIKQSLAWKFRPWWNGMLGVLMFSFVTVLILGMYASGRWPGYQVRIDPARLSVRACPPPEDEQGFEHPLRKLKRHFMRKTPPPRESADEGSGFSVPLASFLIRTGSLLISSLASLLLIVTLRRPAWTLSLIPEDRSAFHWCLARIAVAFWLTTILYYFFGEKMLYRLGK